MELSNQICKYLPKTLVVLDNTEYNLFQARKNIDYHLTNKINIIYKLEDINNLQGLENVFRKFNFDYVFHAAALKHVKIVEENKSAAIKTNIFGSINIIKLFKKFKAKKLVYISTDKPLGLQILWGQQKNHRNLLSSLLKNKFYYSKSFYSKIW